MAAAWSDGVDELFLPFFDEKVVGTALEIEQAVYAGVAAHAATA